MDNSINPVVFLILNICRNNVKFWKHFWKLEKFIGNIFHFSTMRKTYRTLEVNIGVEEVQKLSFLFLYTM